MPVLLVLQRSLVFNLRLRQLVQVLEFQMLDSLLTDSQLDLLPLDQVLDVTLLIPQVRLSLLKPLLLRNPEVVDFLLLLLVKRCELILGLRFIP
jgi:hypothetical protein